MEKVKLKGLVMTTAYPFWNCKSDFIFRMCCWASLAKREKYVTQVVVRNAVEKKSFRMSKIDYSIKDTLLNRSYIEVPQKNVRYPSIEKNVMSWPDVGAYQKV